MTTTCNNNVPGNTTDKNKLRAMINEGSNSMQRDDDEKEALKEIVENISETFDIDKKIVRKMIRTRFKHNFLDVSTENHEFEDIYECVVEGKTATT